MSNLNPFYLIFNEDSTKPVNLGDETFDVVYFDPMFKPQSNQNDYKPIREKNQKKMIEPVYPPVDDYDTWMEGWIQNAVKYVKNTGWVILKLDDYTIYEIWPLVKKYLKWENTIIWDKGVIGLGRRIRKQHECLLILRPKTSEKTFFGAPNIIKGALKSAFHGSSKGKAVSSIWRFMQNNGGQLGKQKKRVHINETPLDLLIKLIHIFVPQGGSVLDLCMGSGSMGMACKKTRRSYCGFELQPEIFKIAESRIESTSIYQDLAEIFSNPKTTSKEPFIPECGSWKNGICDGTKKPCDSGCMAYNPESHEEHCF